MVGDVTTWKEIPLYEVFEIGAQSGPYYKCFAMAFKFEEFKFLILDTNSSKWGKGFVYLHDALSQTATVTLHGSYDGDEDDDGFDWPF
jgi:hypothetical protein